MIAGILLVLLALSLLVGALFFMAQSVGSEADRRMDNYHIDGHLTDDELYAMGYRKVYHFYGTTWERDK